MKKKERNILNYKERRYSGKVSYFNNGVKEISTFEVIAKTKKQAYIVLSQAITYDYVNMPKINIDTAEILNIKWIREDK